MGNVDTRETLIPIVTNLSYCLLSQRRGQYWSQGRIPIWVGYSLLSLLPYDIFLSEQTFWYNLQVRICFHDVHIWLLPCSYMLQDLSKVPGSAHQLSSRARKRTGNLCFPLQVLPVGLSPSPLSYGPSCQEW